MTRVKPVSRNYQPPTINPVVSNTNTFYFSKSAIDAMEEQLGSEFEAIEVYLTDYGYGFRPSLRPANRKTVLKLTATGRMQKYKSLWFPELRTVVDTKRELFYDESTDLWLLEPTTN